MASIKPHKDGFRVFICVNGIRESKVLKGKREAQQWAAARETELRESGKPADSKTLAEVLARYRDEVSPSKRGYRWEEVRINAFLHMSILPLHTPVARITTEELGAWRDARLGMVSSATVLREIALLSAVFECCRREWKLIKVNPFADMRKPKKPEHRSTLITTPQIRRMLVALGHSRKPCVLTKHAVARAFLLSLRTGMRAGEICNLTWGNVFDDYCRLPVTKTTPRDVPLPLKAMRIIQSMKGWDDVFVFGIRANTLDVLFRRYRDKAGLSGFTFHDSRHVAATWMAKRVDVLTLCKVFGWKNPGQAMTYFNPTASDIAKSLTRPLGPAHGRSQ